jgi:hypothetical protein
MIEPPERIYIQSSAESFGKKFKAFKPFNRFAPFNPKTYRFPRPRCRGGPKNKI